MDGLTLRVLVTGWGNRFDRARIDKIHQPAEREIVMTLRTRQGSVRWLLSAHRSFARAYVLGTTRPANPGEPPVFCMRLRKFLEGGRIVEIRQQGLDRALEVVVENVNELGDRVNYVLVLEMMGKHSNLILCTADLNGKPDKVLDSIVHVPETMSRVRPILPGRAYEKAPGQNKHSARTLREDADASGELQRDLQSAAPKRRLSVIAQKIEGAGPVTAQEVLFRTGKDPQDEEFGTRFSNALYNVFEAALNQTEGPSIGRDELGRAAAAAPFFLTSYASYSAVPTLDEALEQVYAQVRVETTLSNRAMSLTQAIENDVDKLRGKLVKLFEMQEEAAHHEQWRIKGELLTAFGHTLSKGMTQAVLPNFYDQDKDLVIELDAALTPMENAQRYFKQGSKHKRAVQIAKREIEQAQADLQYLEETLMHLHGASAENLEAIRQELEQQGFIAPERTRKKAPPKKTGAGQPDAYTSHDGFLIRIGRNNVQNDRLSLRMAQPTDIWMHVKDQPGSHVVISAQRKTVPESTLFEAALLAVYFSKARDSANVAVDYTQAKNVWKPNGSRPGHVLYEGYQTLYVTPDRSLIEPLLRARSAT
ncbi:NFACT family protein [Alicyclobacillus tolerans]|uniref:Rqc2 family fibronectin-binding protein n=1 Tax=Alicyclobacillus tolerans TaxID=90970 RepID=UPI001F26EA68|nr:NFACT RNA binding domain-containing protein [Alicyclobacillus tolerans]MCF8564434.1 NFACT family protein [Alicyclobacillus tolerans]